LKAKQKQPNLKADDFKDSDEKKISWSSSLVSSMERGETAQFDNRKIMETMYRPYNRQFVYTGDKMIHRRGQFDEFFPNKDTSNLILCVEGSGGNKEFGSLITDTMPDLGFAGTHTHCFPIYWYEEQQKGAQSLFDEKRDYIRPSGSANDRKD
jgi:predicted helicase